MKRAECLLLPPKSPCFKDCVPEMVLLGSDGTTRKEAWCKMLGHWGLYNSGPFSFPVARPKYHRPEPPK